MGTCQCCKHQLNDPTSSSKPSIPEGLSLDSISPRLLKLAELAISNQSHTVEIINLSQKDLGEEVSAVFDTVLQHYTHIKVLLLSNTNLGSENWVSFTSNLSNFTKLTTLDLSCNKIGAYGAEKLACSLERLMILESLILNETGLEGSGMVLICGGLVNLRNLKVLSIQDNSIGDIGIRMLSNIINHLPLIQYLDVSHNQISITGSLFLGKCVEGLKNLKVLKAGSNFFMKQGCDHVITKLPLAIEEVALPSVGMEDANLEVFRPLVEKMEKLRVLVLDHNLITCRSLDLLCFVLGKVKLKTLSLVACDMADGRKALSVSSPSTEIFL